MTLRNAFIAAVVAALLGGTATAVAQFSGQLPNNTVLGNISGATAPARPVPMGSLTSLCGAGTTNRIIKFNASDVCVDSNISDDGSGTAVTLAAGGILTTTVTQAVGGGNFNVTVGSGSGAASNGGNFNLLAGNAGTSGTGGSFTLTTGGTASGTSGSMGFNIGNSTSGNVGNFTFTGGTPTSGNGSSFTVALTAGDGGGSNGQFKLVSLPTADPTVTDAIWATNGVLIKSGSTLTCASLGGVGPGCSASGVKQRVAIGWPAGINPEGNIIATIDEASTVTSIVGTVTTPVGAAATLSIYKAPSATACAAGTILHSGTFNANGTANTNQTLTVTTSALSAGDRICLDVSDDANWVAGVGIGGVTVRLTTP